MSVYSPTYFDILEKYKASPHKSRGQLLHLQGVDDLDRYNPALIEDHGKIYVAARVESRHSDWMDPSKYDPHVMFFEKQQYGPWVPVKGAPIFAPMEDPFAAWIHDDDGKRKLIFGGVIILDRSKPLPTIGTAFYKGDNLFTLEKEPFVIIPNMKDIRLVERIHKKEIIVCTRPMVNGFNTGRIGITRIEKLSDFSEHTTEDALIDLNQVADGTWVGNNKLYLIEDKQTKREKVGVLGHIATVEPDGTQHYSAMSFTFDADRMIDLDEPETEPRIIATRDDFEDGATKTEALRDVVFPAGIEHLDNGMVKLYAGLSDARIGSILIPDPFHR
jgi:predicted GH43/DUF377 family glycosyl hydrolase